MAELNAKELFLHITGIAGEMSEMTLSRFPWPPSGRENCLCELEEEGLIRAVDRDGLYGIRLTTDGKHRLAKDWPQRFEGFYSNKLGVDKVRLEKTYRVRAQRMSEVLLFFYLCGVQIFADERLSWKEPVTENGCASYYSSIEIKASSEEGKKMKNARYAGLLRSENGSFLVYSTGGELMTWHTMSEARAEQIIGRLIHEDLSFLLLGDGMNVALKVLKAEGMEDNAFFYLNDLTDSMLFCPDTPDGTALFCMNVINGGMKRLKEMILPGFRLTAPENALECDGLVDEDTAFLFACPLDLVRIRRFRLGCEGRGLTPMVLCFDFQSEMLDAYFEGHAVIKTIALRQAEEILYPGGGQP